MERFRRLQSTLFVFFTLLFACATAQAALTQIQDTVYTPTGAVFNGTVIITWTGSSTTNNGGLSPSNTSVKIYNGVLSVALAPSVGLTPTAYYQAVYNSNDGLTSWTETWQVPASAAPVTLSTVRVSTATSSGGSGSASGSTITMDQVTGLNSYLNALNGSLVTLTSIVNGLNANVTTINNSLSTLTSQVNNLTATSGTSALFTDAEIPAGVKNGVNASFTLSGTPNSAVSLMLYRNGIILTSGVDYVLSGSTISFSGSQIPQSTDVIQAFYRLAGTGAFSSFRDSEIPQGLINGTNVTFTLAAVPNPGLSLRLFKNGVLLEQNLDYALSGSTITFAATSITPQTGDGLVAFYRTTN